MARSVELATGYISLAVSSRGLGRDVGRQFTGIEKASVTTGKKVGQNFVSAGVQSGKNFGRSFGSSVGATLKGALGAAAILGAATKVISFLGEANAEAVDSIKIGKETARVIKTTGGAANVSAGYVAKLSEAISNKTGIDDEAVQSGANLLLTFTAVRDEVGKGNDIFSQATAVVQDMSVVFKQDAKSSAVQLGKALQDPVKGMSALSRVGITFTASQQKQIKALVKSGDLLGAQKIILKEVKKQTEGAAEAQTTYAEKAEVAWGNIKETIGGFVNKTLEPVSKWFVDTGLPAVQDFFKGLGKDKNLKTATDNLKTALTDLVDTNFKKDLDDLAAAIPPAVEGLADFVTKLGEIKAGLDEFDAWTAKHGGGKGDEYRGIGGVFFRSGQATKKHLKNMWHDAKTSFLENHAIIVGDVTRFTGRITGFFKGLSISIKTRSSEMWASVKGTFFKRTDEVRAKVSGWRTSVAGFFTSLGTSIKTRASEMWASVKSTFFKRTDEVRAKVTGWRNSIVATAQNLSASVRGVITGMLSSVTQAFKNGVTAISRAWDKIKAAAKTPVAFVVNTVLEGGLLVAFRAISKLVGYKAGQDFHIAKMASGGVLPGYTPGRDVHHFYSPTAGTMDLSGGEGIARPEIVRAVGAKRWMAANRAAARGQVNDALEFLGPHLGGFASGGIAAAERYARSIGIRSIGTYPGHHPSQALARDFMTSNRSTGERLANWLWANRQAIHLWYEIYWRRIRSQTRPGAGWTPYTRSNPHTDHVHGSFYPAALRGVVGALSAAGAAFAPLIDIGKYIGQVTGALGKLSSIEGTPFGKMVGGIPRKVADAVKAKMTELAAKFTSPSGAGFTAAGGGSNRAIGHRMMLQRWPESQWNPLNSLWTKESGWRTTARNPSSGAYGIPQSLPASKMASAGSDWRTNPATQIKWGLGYIAGRYGTPSAAWAHSQRTNWYGAGGVIPEPVLGFGLNSGDSYGFGEKGKELVMPLTNKSVNTSAGRRPITILIDLGDGVTQRVQGILDENDEFKASMARMRR